MPIIPWQNNDNNQSDDAGNGTANQLMNAAKLRSVVSTAQPVKGFVKRTESENKQYANDLKDRKKQTRLFLQYVKLNLQWQKEDVKSTKVLTHWRVGTFKNLTASGLIVARGAARQSVIAARGEVQFQKIQESAQTQIEKLQQQAQSMASERGW